MALTTPIRLRHVSLQFLPAVLAGKTSEKKGIKLLEKQPSGPPLFCQVQQQQHMAELFAPFPPRAKSNVVHDVQSRWSSTGRLEHWAIHLQELHRQSTDLVVVRSTLSGWSTQVMLKSTQVRFFQKNPSKNLLPAMVLESLHSLTPILDTWN